ncbi:MAG: hypothetical protein LKG25_05365 [Prevotella sp.]|jgi:hypothetical protein|nr:hypothetical protein [Prevotella sp.]MCI1282005.1 hypothetical protein [Prevotella sp.]
MKTMKTNNLLLATITVLTLGMTSCSQSEDVAESTTGKQTITFISGDETTNQTKTRTSMGGTYTDATFPFFWEGGDAIYVNSVQSNGTTSNGISSAIAGKVNGSTSFTKQSFAAFTGTVPALTTGGSYKIRYTGTGSYTSYNQRNATSLTTTSNANTLVIPPYQTMATLGSTTHFGAAGDCGTATATAKSDGTYKFKLNHQAAYLIIMPRWGTGGTNTTYKLKSVIVTTYTAGYYLSGSFSFNDSGIGDPVTNTNGSCTIKIATGGDNGIVLPTAKDQTKSINIAICPTTGTDAFPLYCIYEISNGTNTYYIEKIIPSHTYIAGTVTPITADIKAGYDLAYNDGYLNLITNKNPYTGYYEWGVPNYPTGDVNHVEEYYMSYEMGDDYNATKVTSAATPSTQEGAKTDWFTNSKFNKLPTYNQITWYLKGGCYWQADKKWGPADSQKGGAWLKTKAKIIADEIAAGNTTFDENIFNTTQSGITYIYTQTTAPTDFNTTDWFFLPAACYCHDGYNSPFVGQLAYYWSSTPGNETGTAWIIDLTPTSCNAGLEARERGFSMWEVQ